MASHRFKTDPPPRVPLTIEFHYEVDERGESYRVWEKQLLEPIGVGGDAEHLERHLIEQHP
ncbi:MAG: hypothetical protein ABW133_24185 [Polyangiaceae bacterium]